MFTHLKNPKAIINIAAAANSLLIYNILRGAPVDTPIPFCLAVMFFPITRDFLLTFLSAYQALGLKRLVYCSLGIFIFLCLPDALEMPLPHMGSALMLFGRHNIAVDPYVLLCACSAGALIALASILFRIILFFRAYRAKE